MEDTTGYRIGLVAGRGLFPLAFAKAAQAAGHSVCCVGLLGLAPPELADVCDVFVTNPLGRLGRGIRLFKRARVKHVVWCGKIEKKVLFRRWGLWKQFPDMRAIQTWIRHVGRPKNDDSMLLAVIREFERDGITIQSALAYCPELLVKHGFLTRRKPSQAQWRDIKFGWEMAKEIGRLDIGQTVAVNNMAVVAVEAIEGTDAAIRRAGELCGRSGFTVVKVAKPQQDMRFDVPTIGVDTIQSMQEAGARVLAIEASKTICLENDEVVGMADKLGIAIVSLNTDELTLSLAS